MPRASGAEPPFFSELEDADKAEYWASLALRHCPGLGARSHSKLLKHFGSALLAFDNVAEWDRLGIRRGSVEALRKGAWRKSAREEWEAASRARILLWTSPFYPPLLREISDAPALLYLKGSAALLANPCVAIVGSRRASLESRKIAAQLARKCAESGITIVSGMAMGIDESAHKGSLNEVGRSIGVLGTGIDLCYPTENRELYASMAKNGLLLSEFAPDAKPRPANFPVRNRIISGLSLGTVVVEAAEKSGSLITAHLACEQNREVFAVPGKVYSDKSMGCQNLIRQGAHPVFSHEDILRELSNLLRNFAAFVPVRPEVKSVAGHESLAIDKKAPQMERGPSKQSFFTEFEANASAPEVPREEKVLPQLPEAVKEQAQNSQSERIMACLKNGSRHIEQLAQETALDVNSLNSALIMLELTGNIKRLPGARFEIC